MKHLVETNLPETLKKDYREVFTEEVKKGFLAFAHGEKGSSPEVEHNYVLAKFKESRAELPDEITVLPKYDIDAYLAKGYTCFHIDEKNGADSNRGTKEAPFATIEKAINRTKPGIPTAFIIHAGEYYISDTIDITSKLTGTPDMPFIFTAAGDGEVLISATKKLPYSTFAPVSEDDEIAARIPASVRDKILCADVKALGWTAEEIGVVDKTHLPLLYIDGKMQDIARFPNNSDNQYNLLYFDNVEESGSVVDKGGSRLYVGWTARVKFYVEYRDYLQGKGEKPDWNIVYTYQGKPKALYETEEAAMKDYEKLAAREAEGFAPFIDRFGIWNMDMGFTIRLTPNYQEKADTHITEEDIANIASWKSVSDRNVMIFGNAYEGWDYNHYKIKAIENKGDYYTLTTAGGSAWGAGASGNSPTGHNMFYIYNAPEALDTAGEWYIDTPTGKIYVYPTENFESAKIEYSSKQCNLMDISASNVIVNGIHFDKSSARGVCAKNAEGVVIQNCTLTNMRLLAINVSECQRSAVIYNEFKFNRASSVSLSGYELLCRGVPGFNVIQNNHVDHPIDTQGGIVLGGWRNCASHNVMDLSQITLGGGAALENIVEYNDVRGGHTDTSDAGLIYMNQFAARGTHIRYNYLHSWHAPGNGVYLDDMNQSTYIYGNVIDTTEAPGKKPRGFVYISTGHDHMIYNNFCIGRRHVMEQVMEVKDGKWSTLSYKTKTGVIHTEIGEIAPDGRYPLTITMDGKSYTGLADMTDSKTSRTYKALIPYEGYKSLELWCVKTQSDSEGDSASLLFENLDGTYLRYSNYNDRINQTWLYYTDACWLGYRVPSFIDSFLSNYRFTAYHRDVFEARFPELYEYLDLYTKWTVDRKKEGYRINGLECFMRSAVSNRMDNNVVLGVPKSVEYGMPTPTAMGVDSEGNEVEFHAQNTNTFLGNYDNLSEGYAEIEGMINEYQDKDTPCSFDFRALMQKAEALQKKANPEYESIEFVLDKAGKTE